MKKPHNVTILSRKIKSDDNYNNTELLDRMEVLQIPCVLKVGMLGSKYGVLGRDTITDNCENRFMTISCLQLQILGISVVSGDQPPERGSVF